MYQSCIAQALTVSLQGEQILVSIGLRDDGVCQRAGRQPHVQRGHEEAEGHRGPAELHAQAGLG